MAAEGSILQLFIGAGGIYAAFLYYGSLQEDVLTYTNEETGEKFKYAWFLQVVEAVANVILGGAFMCAVEGGLRAGVPQKNFLISGAMQVTAKYFTTASMVCGVSFPVAMLAKSSKMIPVMVGQLLIGKAAYTKRQYLHVVLIVAGTVLVSSGKSKSGGKPSSMLGLFCLAASLACDGAVGGTQKALKTALKQKNMVEKNFEMQALTNFYMAITAALFAVAFGEVLPAFRFLSENPSIFTRLVKFALCSACGQAFIFYTIKNFDSLTCTTVTTTRKVLSVLWSILTKGHKLAGVGWLGILLACGGILGELEEKFTETKEKKGDPQGSFAGNYKA